MTKCQVTVEQERQKKRAKGRKSRRRGGDIQVQEISGRLKEEEAEVGEKRRGLNW